MRSRHVLVVVIVAFAASVSAALAAEEKIVVEAENYSAIKASMVKKKDSKASGKGWCIWIPLRRPHATEETGPGDDGYAEYKIKIPRTGRYYFWARCHFFDSCGNSFYILVDTTKVTSKTLFIGDSTYGKWHWVGGLDQKSVKVDLTKGVHTIRVQNREDGARMDQFLLTTDHRRAPTRIEKETAQYIIKLK